MTILSSCIFLLLLINTSSAFDSCDQPLGMESGLITDEKIMEINPSFTNKASIRLNNTVACSNINTVLIDLGRLMKITGFAFSSNNDTTATISYAAFEKDLNDVNNIHDISFLKVTDPFGLQDKKIFNIKIGSQKIPIQYVFTLRYIKFHFAAPTCIQLEIYGCPEICSTQLHMPNASPTTTATCTSRQFQYRDPITLTGLVVKSALIGTIITLICLPHINASLVKKNQNISIPAKVTENITIWIPNDLICHHFEIKVSKTFQPSDVSFLGCSTECMVKLIKKSTDEVVSSSSHQNNETHFKPKHSVLNNLAFAWAAQTNTTQEWLQVCFKSSVLVSAIAIQSHGYWGFQRIKNYSLAYSYDEYTFYNYTENDVTEKFPGPESRFGTKVNVLRNAVSVKCIRMRDLDCFRDLCIARWEVLGCLKGIPPVIKVDNDVTISKNTHAILTCRINGQEGAKYHWENNNKKVNESYYYVNTSTYTRHTSFNYSYRTNLYISNNISTFFTSRNDSNCTLVDQTNSVICFMTYFCVAYYVEGDERKEQATVSFTGFYSSVGDPIVSVNSINATSAQLSWSAPTMFGNFPVIEYYLKLVDDINETTIFQELDSSENKQINNLHPYRNYSFTIYAVNRFNIYSKTVIKRFRAAQAAPTAVINLQVKAHSNVQIKITWNLPQTTNGLLSFYFLELTKQNGGKRTMTSSKLCLSVDGLDSYSNYTVMVRPSTKNNELLGPWKSQNITTKEGKPTSPQNMSSYMKDGNLTIQWNEPQKMNGVLQTYKIILRGTKSCFPSFNDSRYFETEKRSVVVHDIFPGTYYTIHVRAITGGGEGEIATKDFQTPGIPTEATVNSGSTAAIAGSIAAVVVLLFLVAVFLVIRQRQQQHEKGKSLELTSICEDNVAVEVVEDIQESTLLTKFPPATVFIHPNHPPVKLVNLPKYLENLKKDSHHSLTKEYKNLDSGQLYEWTEAVVPELKLKNRYADILAYNHSRVKFQQPTSNGSDYVNASFVHGYSCNNMYIASQGPTSTCLGDFWQLIWELNVTVIVMVTNLVEKNKKKCEQYWPEDGSQTYDNFDVSLSGVETFNDYVVRTFILKKVGSRETRFIQQYHFLTWPDHGVPEFPSDLLKFQHKIRRDNPVDAIQSPILVHCSAGVGRTGTFICIDNMLKLARERNMVDVFNYVNFMRSRRIHMVQTVDQYMFIYNALFEALTCGITAIPVSNFTIENQKLLRPNQNNTGKNGYQLQFDRLNAVTRQLTANETKAAMKEANKMKNRSNILPRDISRVILETSLYDNEENYINAVYVNGYKRKSAYIATEHPLETNLYDFWKMILDKKVVTIVTLNSAYENNQTFDKFWPPMKDNCDFGNINVTSESERVDEKIITTNLRVLNANNNKESLQACIVSYDGWHDNGTPSNPKELIQLLTTVESKQMQSDSPIVVMCSDGAGRTGTFIAISILMEQLNTEQDIDVFQTVKKIRTARPEFISNSEKFQLCYKTIQTYLDCFSTYSNFSVN